MAEAVHADGEYGPRWWGWLDMTPIEYTPHLMVVGSVAWGAAATLMSHPGGLWVAMGLFVLIGVIPVAALQITMILGLLKDERVERLKEKVQALEKGRAADRKRMTEFEDILKRNNLA